MSELVLSEKHGSVRVLTLNRPDVLNALNPAIVEALAARYGFADASSLTRAYRSHFQRTPRGRINDGFNTLE